MNIKCPQCQVENDESAQFCSQCGTKLSARMDSTISFSLTTEAGDETKVDLDQLAADGPLLLVVKGIGVGKTFPIIADEVLIGRDPDNDIFLDDVTVSRKHAVIKNRLGACELADIGSLNGTYVNRVRVEEAVLSDRDELQIGKFRMVYIDRHGVNHGH